MFRIAVTAAAVGLTACASTAPSGATLTAHEADITVNDVEGAVVTNNTRGSQKLSAVKGKVSADNAVGEVSLDEITGDSLAASVHDGSVVAAPAQNSGSWEENPTELRRGVVAAAPQTYPAGRFAECQVWVSSVASRHQR